MPVRRSAKTPTVASYEKNRINRQSIRKKNKQNIYYNVCPAIRAQSLKPWQADAATPQDYLPYSDRVSGEACSGQL